MKKEKSETKPGSVLWFALIPVAIALFFLANALFTPDQNYIFPFVEYGGIFYAASFGIDWLWKALYWGAYGVGIVAMAIINLKRRKRYGISAPGAVLSALMLFIFGYIGAKLLYVAEAWETVKTHGFDFSSGVSFYGAVFFIPPAVLLAGRIFRLKPKEYLDYLTPAVVIMLAFIRVGCLLSGCCGGITVMAFGNRPVVLPAQMTESALDVVLLSVLLFLEKADRFNGARYAIFMGGYGLLRFFVEFIRETPKEVLGMSNGQWFSLVGLTVFLVTLALRRLKGKDAGNKKHATK